MKKSLIYSHIVAAASNNTIGYKAKLPWHIEEDLQFFKQTTWNKIVIMGRRTFESLRKPLPHRLNIIVSRNPKYAVPPPAICFRSLEEAYRFCDSQDIHLYGSEVFIIGGGEIYHKSISKVQRIYLTRIHQEYPGDIFYPDIALDEFKEVKKRDCQGLPAYSFIVYERLNEA